MRPRASGKCSPWVQHSGLRLPDASVPRSRWVSKTLPGPRPPAPGARDRPRPSAAADAACTRCARTSAVTPLVAAGLRRVPPQLPGDHRRASPQVNRDPTHSQPAFNAVDISDRSENVNLRRAIQTSYPKPHHQGCCYDAMTLPGANGTNSRECPFYACPELSNRGLSRNGETLNFS